MNNQIIYVITTTADNSTYKCTEHAWTPNLYFASLYAKMCENTGNKASVSQYDIEDKENVCCDERHKLNVVTNNIGEQFLLTDIAHNNAYNIGAFKLVSNKYLNRYAGFFNKNGAGALFSTLYAFNQLSKFIRDSDTKGTITDVFNWALTTIDVGAELDYFTYCTMTSSRIRQFKISTNDPHIQYKPRYNGGMLI